MRRFLLVAMVAMIVLTVAGCGNGDANGTGSEEGPAEEYLIGEIIKVGNLTLKLNGSDRLPIDEFDTPSQEGLIFVAVDVSIENSDAGSEAVGLQSQFSLVDESGEAAARVDHSEAHEIGEDELVAGRTRRGQVVFEVPPDARGLRLVFKSSEAGHSQVVWSIGDAAFID